MTDEWREPTEEEWRRMLDAAFEQGINEEWRTDEGTTDWDRFLESFEGVAYTLEPGMIDLGDSLEGRPAELRKAYNRGKREAFS